MSMLDNNIAILLVDDDEVDVMNVQRAFKKNKINNPVYVANNGLEALEMLRGEGIEKITPKPKIVLLDINMPKMNGLEFLKELRKDPELTSLSVFMLTTSCDQNDLNAAYDLNVAGYIIKPVETGEFIDAIKKLDEFWSIVKFPPKY